MDVIFYFVVSLMIATIFCYIIFLVKNNFQRRDIAKEIAALQTVGTEQQKEYEKNVITYQGKINDFANLLRNHEFASNVFAFMQEQTMPNVWFKQFSLDRKNSSVQLSGESDNLDAFSRQVANFEKNEYVKNIVTLNSSLASSARVAFNINLVLSQDIFDYIAVSALQVPAPEQGAPENNTKTGAAAETSPAAEEESATKSSEKLITSFHLLLDPEVIGTIDEANYTINLDVSHGTGVKSLTPKIVISTGATISPASDVPQNFEKPVAYTVTAEDGSTQNYKAQVVVGPQPEITEESGRPRSVATIVIIALIAVFAIVVIVLLFLAKKSKNKTNKVDKI